MLPISIFPKHWRLKNWGMINGHGGLCCCLSLVGLLRYPESDSLFRVIKAIIEQEGKIIVGDCSSFACNYDNFDWLASKDLIGAEETDKYLGGDFVGE
ncbi:MAG: hypothetical protein Hyperionvirus35_15 [Hyperionvirus sp.]|uniref:Uncharacterized protein n=1 Tax=Hyperionvirus sp. TaxID=2487770 RepID=A0A3G5AH41_9VIRU|nr:MAG: hypothetical protein Hyperionvirus35_15 [Hyperionvirus sp.]